MGNEFVCGTQCRVSGDEFRMNNENFNQFAGTYLSANCRSMTTTMTTQNKNNVE